MATLSRKQPKKINNLVKIKNSLVEGFVKSNNLTALKILFYLAKDKNFKINDTMVIKLNTKQLCSYCKIDEKTLKRNVKQMTETSISITDEFSESYISVIPKAKFNYSGKLEITMFREILEMVTEVKKQYTTIDAEQIMELGSKHSVRMLMLLEQIKNFHRTDKDENGNKVRIELPKKKTYELEELNLLFGTKYTRLGEFDRAVLKKVKTELDSNSKTSFEYEIEYDKAPETKGRPKAVRATIYTTLKD
jgi:plasmid replication initiation protein